MSYKHCASAVARLPQLDFLADVVPPISKNIQGTNLQSKKSTSKSKHSAQDNDNEIPEWARAHPEALAKIQAAQAAHTLLEEQSSQVTGQASDELEPPAIEGRRAVNPDESQLASTDSYKENAMQQDDAMHLDASNVQQSVWHRQLDSGASKEPTAADDTMDEV